MIQAKFGLVAVAERQLETYSTAVLLATESPPKPPRSVRHPASCALLVCPPCILLNRFADVGIPSVTHSKQ